MQEQACSSGANTAMQQVVVGLAAMLGCMPVSMRAMQCLDSAKTSSFFHFLQECTFPLMHDAHTYDASLLMHCTHKGVTFMAYLLPSLTLRKTSSVSQVHQMALPDRVTMPKHFSIHLPLGI